MAKMKPQSPPVEEQKPAPPVEETREEASEEVVASPTLFAVSCPVGSHPQLEIEAANEAEAQAKYHEVLGVVSFPCDLSVEPLFTND